MILDDALKAARSAARTLVERAVFGALSAAHVGTVQRPIPGFSATLTVPANWVDGIVAARMVAGVAHAMMHDYAREARGAGSTWEVLADPLGIPTDEDLDRGAAAFELIAGEPAQRFDRVSVSWRCTTCEKYVTDHGPYDGHPVDCESGHASDCTRHFREIRVHMARVES